MLRFDWRERHFTALSLRRIFMDVSLDCVLQSKRDKHFRKKKKKSYILDLDFHPFYT